ncbi:MAG: 2-keto-3-deoxygluconate kinase [Lysinibacillus sp.]
MHNEQGHKPLRPEDGRRGGGRGRSSAQTFRRGRALAFYQQLVIKRDTLRAQLESPELQSIHPVIAGELKATEAIMNDFKAAFELAEMAEE